MLRIVVIALLFASFAPAALADVVSPEQDVCYDKKPGEACTTCVDAVDTATCGTCVVPPPSCQAGACRRFGDQAACLAEPGCGWESGRPVCSGAPCACNKAATATTKTPDAPAAKSEEKPSSCAAGAPVSLGALAVALSLALLRRRR
jgi:hypothetical protein